LSEYIAVGLALILGAGIAAQWISWKLGLPSILVLLIFGFIAGPVSGLLEPDKFFQDLLFPFVSLSVAIILFEGGLTLKFRELKSVGNVVLRLLVIGIPVTLVLAAFFAFYILNFSFPIAILFGSILVVTGPTVILPLLRQVKPKSNINSILKWEGIVNDPLGALIAILVFEGILAAGLREATIVTILGLLKTVFLSSLLGIIGAVVIVFLIKRDLIPDYLHNSISLSIALAVFVFSNLFQKESGLFAVTIMGIILANQKKIVISGILEFKENLRLILISVLFIILAARLKIETFEELGWTSIVFVGILILIIRPIAVFISAIKTNLSFREKIFISAMAPRGIVAAAVSALFALELEEAGISEASVLVPIMFLVIIATITVYGISAAPLARFLKLAKPNAQGCLIVGASPFALTLGKILQNENFKVVLVDTNWQNISRARMDGFSNYYGSVTSDNIIDEIDYFGLGKMLSLTPNDEVNSLAALNFSKVFGSNQVFQLPSLNKEKEEKDHVAKELKGNILFGGKYNFQYLNDLINNGYVIKSSTITEQYNINELKDNYSAGEIIPLFIIDENNLIPITEETKLNLKPDQVLISLLKPLEEGALTNKL
jgi:NhaP-type Na+/H+ or K+/H+ antiporter